MLLSLIIGYSGGRREKTNNHHLVKYFTIQGDPTYTVLLKNTFFVYDLQSL